eukprot:m.698021 g.698021  ORF g.698021 m.698021 type:complete len:108 (+) comp58683_c0_seq29:1854-2177(+)
MYLSDSPAHVLVASDTRRRQAAIWLIEHGAGIHLRNNDGRTAKDLAHERWCGALASLLEEHEEFMARRDQFVKPAQRQPVEPLASLEEPSLEEGVVVISLTDSTDFD